jgi:hypothetical protein
MVHDDAWVAAGIGRPAHTLRAQNENPNVQYFISHKPLTAEEWEQRYCNGN